MLLPDSGTPSRAEQRETVTPPGEGVVKLASSFRAGRCTRESEHR